VLLKKKSEAIEVKDYRLISLIHSFGKLFDKVLSSQLAPHMDALVMPNQSAFIKGRAIHDNFIAVWSMAKLLHARRCSCVLLKIDIAKAFDTVTWAFLLDLPRHIGFSAKWISWVSLLLSTASTKILINGRPSQHICQARGLRQGDPLSPFLFVLTMEALNAMFKEADARGLLSPLRVPAIHHRVSLHAGDLVIFVLPTESDIAMLQAIFKAFAGTSGLHTSISKCQITPIRYSEDKIALVQHLLPCQLVHFPSRYLGIHLSVYELKKSEL
jgi:hypothetical protein